MNKVRFAIGANIVLVFVAFVAPAFSGEVLLARFGEELVKDYSIVNLEACDSLAFMASAAYIGVEVRGRPYVLALFGAGSHENDNLTLFSSQADSAGLEEIREEMFLALDSERGDEFTRPRRAETLTSRCLDCDLRSTGIGNVGLECDGLVATIKWLVDHGYEINTVGIMFDRRVPNWVLHNAPFPVQDLYGTGVITRLLAGVL